MAKKTIFQEYSKAALSHYDLVDDPIYGVVTSSGVEDVLCTQDEKTYNDILEVLTRPTETDQTFINKKKAFVLPGSPVSNDKIKAALKEHKITVTNDYTQADLMVTHDNINSSYENSANPRVTHMLWQLWNYETTSGGGQTSSFANMIKDHDKHVIITNKITDRLRYYDLDIEDSLFDVWAITGLALNLAHRIEMGDMSTVSIDTVLHTSATKRELTHDLCDQIVSMWNAGGDDRTMCESLLVNLDYTKSLHLMWNLVQELGSIHYNHHNKDLKYWLEASNWERYYSLSAQDMIKYLEEEEKLNKESFRYLEPIVRKDIQIHNRDLYVFKVAVKKEYQQYLK